MSTSLSIQTHQHETADEIVARYRALRRKFYSAPPSSPIKSDKPKQIAIVAIATSDPSATITVLPPRAPRDDIIATEFNFPRQRARAALLTIARSHNVNVLDILSAKRHRPTCRARQDAIWVIKKITTWSLPQIGQFFERDHTTILHAINRVDERIATDRKHRARIEEVAKLYAAPPPRLHPIIEAIARLPLRLAPPVPLLLIEYKPAPKTPVQSPHSPSNHRT